MAAGCRCEDCFIKEGLDWRSKKKATACYQQGRLLDLTGIHIVLLSSTTITRVEQVTSPHSIDR